MSRLSRRLFLEVIGAAATSGAIPACSSDPAPSPDEPGFFTGAERRALATLADYVLPPDDTPGGKDLGAVPYIEGLMVALEQSPPRIHAGGPYSGRQPFPDPNTGAASTQFPPNDFLAFLPLSRVAQAAWRLRLYGSSDKPGPNDAVLGPTKGLRVLMKEGLADAMNADRPLEQMSKDDLSVVWGRLPTEFTDTLCTLVIEAALSPEYGGNKDLAGWKKLTHTEGDVHPLGYSVFDQTAGIYRERLPVSGPDVGPDPDPLSDEVRASIVNIVGFLGGAKHMSSAVLGNTSLTQFDTIVIGSGAGGSAVAAILTLAGQKVLVLEAGPNYFDGLDDAAVGKPVPRFSNDDLKLERRYMIMPDPLVDPRTFRPTDAAGERTFTGEVNSTPKTVGGCGVHADLKTPRFEPDDLRLGTLIGSQYADASFADWPVTYDQLEPFYAWAEKTIGVQGLDGADPKAGRRSTPYPMPPGVAQYGALKLVEGAKKLGLHPFPYPSAVNSRPYGGRPPCVDCGFCGGFGCPSNAKGSPAVTHLRTALLSGKCQLRSETRAVRLLLSATKNAIDGVEVIGPDGARQTLKADRYVLSASAIEDARLLLLSDPGGPGVGNSSGMVGRNLTFHFQTLGLGVLEERIHNMRNRSVTHGITDFRGVAGDPNRPLAGIVELGAATGPLAEAITYSENLERFGPKLKALIRQAPFRDRSLVLTMQAEDAPQTQNRVDLDPQVRDLDGLPVSRITYKSHAFELSARKFYAPKMLDLMQAAGARWAFLAPINDISASRHIMGTLRFGSDPKSSVCDEGGRFHDIGNLYAADGSLFPTSSGYNPFLTIVTLAARVAGGIAYPGSPERALA